MSRPEPSDTLGELLRPALDAALEVVRTHGREPTFPAVPAPLARVVGFARVPARAAEVVLTSLDADDELREAVADHLDPARFGRSAALWFSRPDGWADELDGIVAEMTDADRSRATERDLERALADLAQLRARISGEDAALDHAHAELAEARRSIAAQAAEIAELTAQLGAADERVASAIDERNLAVRQWKETERLLNERTAELRRGDRPGDREIATSDVGAVAVDPVDRLAAAALVDAAIDGLGELRSLIAPRGEVVVRRVGPIERSRARPTGLMDDSPEGLRWLLSRVGATLLVDGYNVTMSRWPALDAAAQRSALERALETLQRTTAAMVHVVWDGDVVAGQSARRHNAPLRVTFTDPDVEADDVIIELARRSSGSDMVVVSDDRRVRRGAAAGGATAVSVASLVALL